MAADDHVARIRGAIVETQHRVSVAVSDGDGHLVWSAGDPRAMTTLRSTAKPFQALAALEAGAELDDAELALACASHEGTPDHVSRVAAWLSHIGLTPEDLRCGGHAPMDPASRDALAQSGAKVTNLHNNCSGKHTAMLMAARCLDASLETYLKPSHPLQQAIRALIIELCGSRHLEDAVDGCSAPTFGMGLHRLARMFAQLAEPASAPAHHRAGLTRVSAAMRAHPELVAGGGVLDTVLMRSVDGLVAKRGADGCYAMAVTAGDGKRYGVALKVADGNSDARAVAVLRTLEDLGVVARDAYELAAFRRMRRINCRGTVVGHVEARFSLQRHA